MRLKSSFFAKLYTILMMLQILTYFLNSDMYLQISGMFLFMFLAILMGMFWLLLHISHWSSINAFQIISMLWIICLVISILANFAVIESGYVLSYLLLLIMVFIFSSMKFEKEDLNRLTCAYIALGVVISLLIIIIHKRFYAEDSTRITIQIGTGPLIDPNYLGACLVGPFFLILQKMMNNSDGKRRSVYLATIIIILLGVFLTGSRGALLALVVGILVVFHKALFQHITANKIVFVLIVAIGAVGILSIIPEETKTRFFDIGNWMDASNSRRLALWENAVIHILKKPWFGYGLANTVNTIGNAAHNTYLEICVHFGVVGGLLYIALFCALLFRKTSRFMKAIVLSTMVWSIFISAEATMFLWLNISICIAYCNMEKGERDAKKS